MSDNIETPEGWERRGPCFIREHGGKLAVIDPHPEKREWWWVVYSAGEDSEDANRFVSLTEAIHLANEHLGVPKPIEVVRKEYEDAWMLTSEQTGRSWRVSKDVRFRDYPDVNVALRVGEEYVRGDE